MLSKHVFWRHNTLSGCCKRRHACVHELTNATSGKQPALVSDGHWTLTAPRRNVRGWEGGRVEWGGDGQLEQKVTGRKEGGSRQGKGQVQWKQCLPDPHPFLGLIYLSKGEKNNCKWNIQSIPSPPEKPSSLKIIEWC